MSVLKKGRKNLAALAAVSVLAMQTCLPIAHADEAQRFEIEAQELAKALINFSQQAKVVVVAPAELVKGRFAPAVSGDMEPTAAVQRLLEGTNLAYTRGANGQFIIVQKSDGGGSSVAAPNEPLSSADTQLEEIVVTSTRRAEGLSRVPLSVAAFKQEQLDRQGVHTFEDVARLTPGVTFSRATRGNTSASNLSIRGISSGAGAATVGVYIDETPVQVRPQSLSSSNPYPRVFDLDRVEILRGPQGTLFGAGSEGGTIRFITPEPGLTEYTGLVRSEVSASEIGAMNYEVGGALGGPIVQDKLGFRLGAWTRTDGGYVDRIDWNTGRTLDNNANGQESYVVRGALKWQATDSLAFTPAVFFQRTDIDDSSIYWEYFSDPDAGRFRNGNPLRTPTHDKFVLPSLKVEWDLGPVALFSNSSYFDRTNRNVYDQTTLGLANLVAWPNVLPPASLTHTYGIGNLSDEQKVFTQELRIQNTDSDARFNWVAGVFFQRAKQYSTYVAERPFIEQEILFRAGVPLTVEQFFGVPLYQGRYQLYSTSDTLDQDMSVYGNVDYKLTERLKVIAGVRMSKNKYTNDSFGAGPTVTNLRTGTFSSSRKEDEPVSPKFGLSFQATPNNLFYTTAAKGYRQGSTTGQVTNRCDPDLAALGLTAAPREIDPDTVWSYEVGSKSRLLGGALQLDASAFQVDWKNIQSSLILPNCNIPIIANTGDARSRGFDLQANANFGGGLTAGFSLGYVDAEYVTSTTGAGGRVIRSKGEPLPVSPWTVAVSTQYDTMIASRDSYVRLDYQYASHDDTALDLASAAVDPTIPRAPSSSNLDLRLGMNFDQLDLSVFVANALDQHPEYGRYRDTTRSFNYRGVTVPPRTFGITAIYRY